MKYIAETGEENPYYAEYDYLLEIAKEYELALSGDGLRPGVEAASDRAKYMEFIVLGELVDRARVAEVQAMVEGPGHVPADEIETSAGHEVPDQEGSSLPTGPLVTDVAPGYDHITAAMGGVSPAWPVQISSVLPLQASTWNFQLKRTSSREPTSPA